MRNFMDVRLPWCKPLARNKLYSLSCQRILCKKLALVQRNVCHNNHKEKHDNSLMQNTYSKFREMLPRKLYVNNFKLFKPENKIFLKCQYLLNIQVLQ
jgi:hypothetical protein